LIAHFSPVDESDEARIAIAKLRQHGPVTGYIRQFRALSLQVPDLVEDGEGRIAFITGLKPALQAEVRLRRPTTLLQAMSLAVSADAPVWRRERAFASATFGGSSAPHAQGTTDGPVPMELGAVAAVPHSGSSFKCYICGRSGHGWRKCPDAKRHPCRRCGRAGHPTMFCRRGNPPGR
jgi:hypothetical protein